MHLRPLLILIALSLPLPLAALPAQVTVGVLAPEGPELAEHEWAELGWHLNLEVPETEFRLAYFDLAALRQAVAERAVEFVITNSGHYVELEAAFGVHRIATLEPTPPITPEAGIASAIVVRADSPIRQLAQLAGQRVLAVSEEAFGGYRVAWRELREHGLEPMQDFTVEFSGFPLQNIVHAVARGEADAGIVRACVLENMAERGELALADFRVLAAPARDDFPCLRSTRLYPDWPFAALKHTPHELSKAVATSLLSMPRTASGIAWTVPTDYQSVHELFRTLQTGPYSYLRDHGVTALMQRYRAWLALLLVLVAGWAVHTYRVKRLVQVRTRDLAKALEARRQAEEEARAQQEKLDHLARLGILGELSSMLAHELNQPLSAIGNFARGMERRIENGRLEPGALLEASREIAEQADRARDIMQGIRAFTTKRASSRAPLLLGDVVDGAVALFAGMGRHAPTIVLEVDRRARVFADRLQLEQVLLNLLKNALDAMQETLPNERRIRVTCHREAGNCHICVSDNGKGLDPELTPRLFEPFFTTRPDGMGLGLTICKRIIEAHGGRLWVEAHQGAPGLTVCFALPVNGGEP